MDSDHKVESVGEPSNDIHLFTFTIDSDVVGEFVLTATNKTNYLVYRATIVQDTIRKVSETIIRCFLFCV